MQKGAFIYKSREELAFFGDAQFPVSLDSPILMKLSGFGDYEQCARWSELPTGCFNNRGKFNIDGRRINNSRITSGGDIHAPIVAGVEKAARGSEISRNFGKKPHSRARLFHYDFSWKTFSVCITSNIIIIYRLIPPSILSIISFSLSPRSPSSIADDCVFFYSFFKSFWNINVALLTITVLLLCALTRMKLGWIFTGSS